VTPDKLAAPTADVQLGFWVALALFVIPGAFGGALSVLQLIDISRLIDASKKLGIANKNRLFGAILVGALGGVGGSLASLVVGVWTGKLNFTQSTSNCLFLLALSVVAGFLGFKLLKKVATNFEKSIRDSENRLMENQETERQQLIEDEAVINQGLSLSQEKNVPDSDIEGLLPEMQALLTRRNTDRRVGIVLGNLYDRLGQHERAAATVTQVLDSREAAGMDSDKSNPDKNCSDLRYNRACYRVPLWVKEQDAAKKDDLKKTIISDLRLSFVGSASNRDSARVDTDFTPIHKEPEFMALFEGTAPTS
jgi:hypothetical protein